MRKTKQVRRRNGTSCRKATGSSTIIMLICTVSQEDEHNFASRLVASTQPFTGPVPLQGLAEPADTKPSVNMRNCDLLTSVGANCCRCAGRVLAPEVTGDLGQLHPELVKQLTIPEMQSDGRSPAACGLPSLQVSQLDREIVAAQELLGKAALSINKAESKAGKPSPQ